MAVYPVWTVTMPNRLIAKLASMSLYDYDHRGVTQGSKFVVFW